MQKKRPFGVTLLAILAAIGAIIAIIHTLQMLHLFPISGPFGQMKFFTFDLFGALMWGLLALIYIWVVRMLWNLDPQGWLFVVILATLNLILAVISMLGASSWQAMMPSILVNGLILIYGMLPGTKAAFGTDELKSEPAAPKTTAPAAASEPVAAAPEVAAVEPQVAAVAAAAVVVDEVTEPDEEIETAAAVVEVAEPEEEAAPAVDTAAVAATAAMVTGAAADRNLRYVADMGEENAAKLKAVGITTPQQLLEKGATPQGRKELADETGLSHALILRWLNEVDLYRIKGLGAEYANLIEAAGVDTVPELAQRNPANLYEKIVETNEEKKLVQHLPSAADVADWVNQAKQLPRLLTY